MTSEKRLTRSRTDRVVAGVCGGLGRYLGVDPVVVRLVWAICTILTLFGGVVAYLVAWFLVPEEPLAADQPDAATPAATDHSRTG